MFGIKKYFTVLIIWLILEYDKNRLWSNNFCDGDEIEINKPKIIVAFQLADDFIKQYNSYCKDYNSNV